MSARAKDMLVTLFCYVVGVALVWTGAGFWHWGVHTDHIAYGYYLMIVIGALFFGVRAGYIWGRDLSRKR